jgi:hypothetical protein
MQRTKDVQKLRPGGHFEWGRIGRTLSLKNSL